MKKKKTYFLAVNQGFSSRFLLRTDIFKTLKESGNRIVILSPNADEPYFREEFSGKNIFFERVREERYKKITRYKLERFLRNLRWFTTNAREDDHTVRLRYNILKKERPAETALQRTVNLVFDCLAWALARSAGVRKAEICLESLLFTPDTHRDLFEKYHPDHLLITSMGIFGYDHFLIREARKHGTNVVVLPLSWDNSSSKGVAGAFADWAVVWSGIMEQEMLGYYDFSPKRIFVGGIPHFDTYFNPLETVSRASICKRLGLDPEKRILFYTLKSPNKYPWNSEIVEGLAKAVEDNLFHRPCQLLVRLHPISMRRDNGRPRYAEELRRHEEIARRYACVTYDIPRVLSDVLAFDMPEQESEKLAAVLRHSDVLLSYFSTMMIEASIFDVPAVNVALHSHTDRLNKGDLQIMKAPHIKRILETSGVSTAFSFDELIAQINLHLNNPEATQAGRELIKQRETAANAGHAGRTIGEFILSI